MQAINVFVEFARSNRNMNGGRKSIVRTLPHVDVIIGVNWLRQSPNAITAGDFDCPVAEMTSLTFILLLVPLPV